MCLKYMYLKVTFKFAEAYQREAEEKPKSDSRKTEESDFLLPPV